ncbi:MAG: hypothetical protein R2729_28050 [Bryobacteraceae bacterium]
MQVHYKIPGWEPIRELPVGGAMAAASPFPALAPVSRGEAVSWRALLRLEAPAAGVLDLGPPPRPDGWNVASAEVETRAIRVLLGKHGHEAEPSKAGATASGAVREMVLLLLDMQSRQDELVALRAGQEGA